jgi:hypothetical protein
MSTKLWPQPLRRDVGAFSDLSLYVDALELACERTGITAKLLKKELRPRLRARRLVKEQSPSGAQNLMEELRLFGWVELLPSTVRRTSAHGTLTTRGREALILAHDDRTAFLRVLAERMHVVYIVPGWFVNRLWTINPSRGEVILPAPISGWSPSEETRQARAWTAELEEQTHQAASLVRAADPLAFPLDDETWREAVRQTWERLRDRKVRNAQPARDPVTGTRSGLTLAMRWASLTCLFGRVPFGQSQPDFPTERPLTPRTFKPWCPRLQALELIGYTDWHPSVSGRLLYPTSVFRAPGAMEPFEELPGIRHPDGRPLALHQPSWGLWRQRFWDTLVTVYDEVFHQVQSRYISLLNVRDEVCRRLRLSPARFDRFLGHALAEVPPEGGRHLSIETDMREDLRTARGLARRPVYVGSVPHTLIAVARLPRVPRSAS